MRRASRRAVVALGWATIAALGALACGDNGKTSPMTEGTDGGGNGSVQISIATDDCPIWNTLVANPSSAYVHAPGNSVELVASARGEKPSKLTFAWKASAGTISASAEDGLGNDTATFTCPSTPTTVKITLVVGDGLPAGEVCPAHDTTGSVNVKCDLRPTESASEDGG